MEWQVWCGNPGEHVCLTAPTSASPALHLLPVTSPPKASVPVLDSCSSEPDTAISVSVRQPLDMPLVMASIPDPPVQDTSKPAIRSGGAAGARNAADRHHEERKPASDGRSAAEEGGPASEGVVGGGRGPGTPRKGAAAGEVLRGACDGTARVGEASCCSMGGAACLGGGDGAAHHKGMSSIAHWQYSYRPKEA